MSAVVIDLSGFDRAEEFGDESGLPHPLRTCPCAYKPEDDCVDQEEAVVIDFAAERAKRRPFDPETPRLCVGIRADGLPCGGYATPYLRQPVCHNHRHQFPETAERGSAVPDAAVGRASALRW